MSHISKMIITAREKNGLTQEGLAKMLGLFTGQVVSNWERGIQGVPFVHLRAISKKLKIPAKDIVTSVVKDFGEYAERELL